MMSQKGTQPTISLIVPTRNEAANVPLLLSRLSQAAAPLLHEVLFVDDSDDETGAVILAQNGRFPFPIRLIDRPLERRNGLSGAVVEGLRAATGTWVAVMDADLQHPPETLPRLLARAEETGADLVVGSRRFHLAGPVGLTRFRTLTSQSLTILARMLFPRTLKNVSDPLTGLFLVRRAGVDPDVLNPEGFKILLEILARCPALYVSEILFEFGERHGGESKADFREGLRFFRHLLRMRATVNHHLWRFGITAVSGLLLNLIFLILFVELFGWRVGNSAVLSTELHVIFHFLLVETWVFAERKNGVQPRRLLGTLLFNQLLIGLLLLPTLWLGQSVGLPYWLAHLLGVGLMSLLRYALSEQWIWTRGLTIGGRGWFYYDLHGIVKIASQVPFAELSYFKTAVPLDSPDLQIRLDRHGTPSPAPEAIQYDEQLGRFGFGLTIKPGDYTEVVVSPLLERSPPFLFTNVVEPMLRWSLVRKEVALLRGAAMADNGEALLLTGSNSLGQAVTALCQAEGLSFMGDDWVIVNRDGQVWSYPKPLTVRQTMLKTADSRWQRLTMRLALRLQNLLYSRPLRALGLWLSQNRLPAATLNTYIQSFIPQPKHMMATLSPDIDYADEARLTRIVWLQGDALIEGEGGVKTAVVQQNLSDSGFAPYPLLMQQMQNWQGVNWLEREQGILKDALRRATAHSIITNREDWWQPLAEENNQATSYLFQK